MRKQKKQQAISFEENPSKPLIEWALEKFYHDDVDRFLIFCRNEEHKTESSYVNRCDFKKLCEKFNKAKLSNRYWKKKIRGWNTSSDFLIIIFFDKEHQELLLSIGDARRVLSKALSFYRKNYSSSH